MMRRTTLILIALATACGGSDDPVSTIDISIEFPSTAAARATNSLHFWVLEPAVDSGVTCAALRSGEADPYHSPVRRLADFVVFTADAEAGTADAVTRGETLVYVEGVDFIGQTVLSGCKPLTIVNATEAVGVTMGAPGTYDCTDSGTSDGDPCDDGLFCTTGETCSAGACGSGGQRDCTFVADDCNAESCSEDLGCQPTPVPNGRPCEEGVYCTVGDTCTDGECIAGGPRDCTGDDGTCRVGTCREDIDGCVPVIDDNVGCDDGLYCTVGDDCSGGQCATTPFDCSAAANDCNASTCTEGAGAAVCGQSPIRQGFSCNSNCTTLGTCSSGLCAGGTPIDPGLTTESIGDGNCANFVDDDCDGNMDAADLDC
jgi:hypothetical protein